MRLSDVKEQEKGLSIRKNEVFYAKLLELIVERKNNSCRLIFLISQTD